MSRRRVAGERRKQQPRVSPSPQPEPIVHTVETMVERPDPPADPQPVFPSYGRRCILLVVLSVVFILAAVAVIRPATRGFSSPPAVMTGDPFVQLAVVDPPTGSLSSTRNSALIDAGYLPGSYARYALTFPKSMIGHAFALELMGSAVLADAFAAGSSITSRTFTCTVTPPNQPYKKEAALPCQIIYGMVPKVADTTLSFCEQVDTPGKYGQVVITGRTENVRAIDWAHKAVDMPAILDNVPSAFEAWDATDLSESYKQIYTNACRVLWSPALEVTDLNPTTNGADDSAGGDVWAGATMRAPAIAILRNRNAEATANGLVAIGVTTAALSVAFIPMAYEAGSAWRLERRRRRRLPQ